MTWTYPVVAVFTAAVTVAFTGCGDSGSPSTTEASTSTAGTTESGTDTASTTSEPLACEDFLDEEVAGPEVTITFRNTTSGSIYIRPIDVICSVFPGATLTDPNGEKVYFDRQSCGVSCDEVFAGECICGDACSAPPIVYLTRLSTYQFTWDGAVFRDETPPEMCLGDGCGPTCQQREQAVAGDYTFAAAAGTVCDGPPEICDCEPGPDGWCVIYTAFDDDIGGADFTAEAVFTYPDTTEVELVF